MEPDAKGDSCPAAGAASQNAKAAKHVPMDVFRLGGVLRFLEQSLYAWDMPTLLGLFDPIPNQDMEAPFFIEGANSLTAQNQRWRIPSNDQEEALKKWNMER